MVKFVAALRREQFPNRSSFVKKLKEHDLENNENIACSVKTIQRDITALVEEFGAPIEFDSENNGYFLTRSDWKFRCPVFQEDELLALAIGSCVASKIFPAPISSDIQDAFDYQLSENNYDGGFDHLEQLMISSGLNVQIQPEVFNKIYNAWKDRHCVKMVYTQASGLESERIIEPQLLVFHERAWMLKAYCHQRRDARNFAVHRIQSITLLDEQFKYRKEFSPDAQGGSLYNLARTQNIKLRCNNSIFTYICEQPLHKNQIITDKGDDTFILELPEMTDMEIVKWILGQAGNATVLQPEELKQQVLSRAQLLLAHHS